MVELLCDLVRQPSVTGTDAEHDLLSRLAAHLSGVGMDVDHWQVPLAETLGADGFPGLEAERSEAWGLVGRLDGSGDGPTLMLNAHVDVVPPGDLATWTGGAPYSG